jgi:arylsulfatase
MKTTALAVSAATLTVLTFVPALAQQATGVPGSPSATTTIDGKYLPPQPPQFGGAIKTPAYFASSGAQARRQRDVGQLL